MEDKDQPTAYWVEVEFMRPESIGKKIEAQSHQEAISKMRQMLTDEQHRAALTWTATEWHAYLRLAQGV